MTLPSPMYNLCLVSRNMLSGITSPDRIAMYVASNAVRDFSVRKLRQSFQKSISELAPDFNHAYIPPLEGQTYMRVRKTSYPCQGTTKSATLRFYTLQYLD